MFSSDESSCRCSHLQARPPFPFPETYFTVLPLVCSFSSAADKVTANRLTIRMQRRRIVARPAFTLFTLFFFCLLFPLCVGVSPCLFPNVQFSFFAALWVSALPDAVSSPLGLFRIVLLVWLQ